MKSARDPIIEDHEEVEVIYFEAPRATAKVRAIEDLRRKMTEVHAYHELKELRKNRSRLLTASDVKKKASGKRNRIFRQEQAIWIVVEIDGAPTYFKTPYRKGWSRTAPPEITGGGMLVGKSRKAIQRKNARDRGSARTPPAGKVSKAGGSFSF